MRSEAAEELLIAADYVEKCGTTNEAHHTATQRHSL
jgi:hypothetical protein